jgi:Ca2+-transporting ATPase
VLGLSEREAVTISFLTLAAAQLWHVFDVRSPSSGVLRNEITRNGWVWAALALCAALLLAAVHVPPLADVLQIAPPSRAGWGLIAAASLAPMLLGQLGIALGVGSHRRRAR